MADTVLNTTVFDGAKRLITHYNVVGDGTGNTTKIVDVSEVSSKCPWESWSDQASTEAGAAFANILNRLGSACA